MLNINIPKPCHEDWDKMSPDGSGRHCGSCMKTVVDFTGMNDNEVKNYLIARRDEHLCGRFSSTQLKTIQVELPANIFSIEMPLWKQFLLACLVAFSMTLFSCDVKQADSTATQEPLGMSFSNEKNSPASAFEKYIHEKDSHGWVGMFIHEYSFPDSTFTVVVDTTAPSIILGGIGMFDVPDSSIIVPVADCKLPVPENPEIIKGEIMMVPDTIPVKKDSTECVDFS